MKHLFYLSAAALIFGGCQASSEAATSTKSPVAVSQAMATPVKAVRIYADWCSKCKVLDAQLKELRAENDYPNIEFVYLDFTKKDPDIFYTQAKELGIEAQVKAALGNRVRTGQMFLFDAKTDALLKTITHTGTTEELSEALTSATS